MAKYWVEHCGHPTALFPWAVYCDGYLVTAPNGMAFSLKRFATECVERLKSGELRLLRFANGLSYPVTPPDWFKLTLSSDMEAEWKDSKASDRAWHVIWRDRVDPRLKKYLTKGRNG